MAGDARDEGGARRGEGRHLGAEQLEHLVGAQPCPQDEQRLGGGMIGTARHRPPAEPNQHESHKQGGATIAEALCDQTAPADRGVDLADRAVPENVVTKDGACPQRRSIRSLEEVIERRAIDTDDHVARSQRCPIRVQRIDREPVLVAGVRDHGRAIGRQYRPDTDPGRGDHGQHDGE
ncbi:MAG: hypothetical protein ACRD03_15610 [Acidimicrobiales bacterium]